MPLAGPVSSPRRNACAGACARTRPRSCVRPAARLLPLRLAVDLRAPLLPLCLVAGLAAGSPAHAHGGAYRGPADAVPPAGSTPPVPTSPAGSSPGVAPRPPAPGVAPPSAPSTPGIVANERDSSIWELWWGYNCHDYFDVRGAVHSSDLQAGSAGFFLGHRAVGGASDRIVPSREAIEQQVVPALLRVLAEERDADMVTGALVALAKIGEVPGQATSTSERISAFLADENQEIAETAAISLGILADRGSVGLLRGLLFDRPGARELVRRSEVPWRTRAFAAYGLGLIGNRVDDEDVREQIVSTLLGALSSEEILGLATPDVPVACISAIGIVPLPTRVGPAGVAATGRMRQIEALLAFAQRPRLDFRVRAHVVTAVSRLMQGAPAAWGLQRRICGAWIRDLAPDSEVHRAVQQSTVLALGRVGRPGDDPIDRAIRAALLRASEESPNIEVRRFAWIALAQIGSRASEEDAEQGVASGIRSHLIACLDEVGGDKRAWAALALGVLGRRTSDEAAALEKRTDELLIEALGRASAPQEVGATAMACGLRRQEAASAALLAKLAEVRDDAARGYVCLALGMAGADAALGPIREVVRRSKYRPELLRQAAISLGLLGDKDVVPELIDMLQRASSLSAQASVAFGLGAIGDARSIDPLIRMLGDRDITPRARAFAAVALGIVADKEPRPWNAKLSIGVNYRANTTTLTDGHGAGILEIL